MDNIYLNWIILATVEREVSHMTLLKSYILQWISCRTVHFMEINNKMTT